MKLLGRSGRAEFGKKYHDPISGFEGTATAISEFLHGCRRIQLSGSVNGEPKDYVFDEPQLEPIETPKPLAPTRGKGGPKTMPPRTGL